MTKIRVNKIDAARRQIDAAIRLLFDNDDPVAIHTLQAAGFRILRDLSVKSDKASVWTSFKAVIRPGMEKEAWAAMSKPANFFKHADRDAEGGAFKNLTRAEQLDVCRNSLKLGRAQTSSASLLNVRF